MAASKFLQNYDIVPAFQPQSMFGSAASDTSAVITMKNADRATFLLNFGVIDAGVAGRIEFYACSGVDGSDEALIEPVTFREKENDGSDQWSAPTTVTDGLIDVGGGDNHIINTDDNHSYLFEFTGAEVYNEGVAAGGNIRDCIKCEIVQTNTDGSDALVSATWILHPNRYSNGDSTSFDNLSN